MIKKKIDVETRFLNPDHSRPGYLVLGTGTGYPYLGTGTGVGLLGDGIHPPGLVPYPGTTAWVPGYSTPGTANLPQIEPSLKDTRYSST